MTLEIGARLGHYRILALLGRGGMADVFRAEDERLGREVALKAVPPEFARDPERVERFEREVRAAARLSHPNIVTVYEYGQGEGLHFYTMELMPGGHLKARIQAQPDGMPAQAARAVVLAMARALEYAHGRGFAHRDVKPENILFGEDGTPQLTDFGIARAMSEGTRMTKTGMSIGSPHYMSPEQAQGLLVDGRSDLYSLGVVLYEMLTGQLPFDGPDTFAVGLSHIQDPVPELPPRLSNWQSVLDRLLAKSPQDRYRRAEDLVEVLESVSRPQVPVTRVTPVERELDSTKRIGGSVAGLPESTSTTQNYAMLAALVGILLALAAVGMCYVVLQDTRRPSRLTSNGGGDDGEMANARERARPVRRRQERSPIGQERPTRARPRQTRTPLAVIGGRARLVVETSPPGVEVLVDGTPVGETPLRRSDIRAGSRAVTLRHPHYETVRENRRRFRDGRVVRIRRTLVRGRGALRVTAVPRQAWVEVEGKRMAERTPVTLKDLPAGRVEVKTGAPKHRPLALEVEIPKNGLARLERRLEPVAYGSLTLELSPSDARAMLPDLGLRYRPGMRLPQGSHRVVVRREGYGEATRAVEVSGITRARIVLDRRQNVLFSDDFSSGTYSKWTTVGKGSSGGSPNPGRLSIVDGVLRIKATAGGNYDLRAVKEIFLERRYGGYWLSFDWKAVTRETPWGLDGVRLMFYDDRDRLIGQVVAVNSGQTRRGGNVLDHVLSKSLSKHRQAGIGKLAETFDWQRVTLATSMIPGMDSRHVARLELRAWVYNDAGRGGEMHFDNFELRTN